MEIFEILSDIVLSILDAGAVVMMPIIITIFGLIFGNSFSKSS